MNWKSKYIPLFTDQYATWRRDQNNDSRGWCFGSVATLHASGSLTHEGYGEIVELMRRPETTKEQIRDCLDRNIGG